MEIRILGILLTSVASFLLFPPQVFSELKPDGLSGSDTELGELINSIRMKYSQAAEDYNQARAHFQELRQRWMERQGSVASE
ncbi:MAG TPA: hypothetical protein VM223_27695, partial [Planctomycetota bacterium]|nr:hypothetical protein [Planctomycetota bacterium]